MTPDPSMHPAEEELQRYADGELTSADGALRTHVEQCAQCQAHVERIRRVTAALALSSTPPPARPLPLQHSGLPSPAGVKERGRRWRRAAIPLALLAAAAALLVVFNRRRETPREDSLIPPAPIARVDSPTTLVKVDTPRSRNAPDANVGFGPRTGRVIVERTLYAASSARIDSLARAAGRDTSVVVRIAYDTASVSTRALADSIASVLQTSGIASARIRREPAASGATGVRIRVARSGSK